MEKVSKKWWLRKEISDKYSQLNTIEIDLYYTHVKILTTYYSNNITFNCFWLEFDNYVHSRINCVKIKQSRIHNKKIKNLKAIQCKKPVKPVIPIISDFVHNMSSADFTTKELNILNKGLNFATKPNSTPLEEIVVDIESGISRCSGPVKNNIRFEAQKIIIQHINKGEKESTSSETKTIAALKRNTNIVFTRADKGNAVVILDKEDYDERVLNTISEGPYKEHKWKNGNPRDPLNSMIKQAKSASKEISSLLNEPQLEYRFHVTNPKVSKLYALPKIHKPGNKMRPIASNICTPTENMAKWLLNELNQIPPPPGCSIQNSKELVEKLKNIILKPDEILVSFDVTALFPSIPINLAIQYMEEHLLRNRISQPKIQSYMKAAKTCMDQNYIQFRGKYYKQTSGTSMGSKLAPYLSNIFMSHFEENLKGNYSLFPRIWLRYVDDIVAIVKKENLQTIFEHINNIHQSVKFTMELEENNILNFLDIKIIRRNNMLKFGIFRKSTNTNRFITIDSFHHITHKQAAFHSMAHRLFNIPLEETEFNNEVQFIRQAAIANGYSVKFADKIINKHKMKHMRKQLTTLMAADKVDKTRVSVPYYPGITNKLQRVFNKNKIELVTRPIGIIKKELNNFKDKESSTTRSGIYQIKCNDCQDTYIGQTSREFGIRLKEHEKAARNKSSVAEHMIENHHSIDTANSKIIRLVHQKWKLDAFESYHIANTAELMNTEDAKIISPLFKISNNSDNTRYST